MATKTITLSEDAYRLLRAEKGKGESFSDVVRRLSQGRKSIQRFAGAWKDLPTSKKEEIREAIESLRREADRRTAEKLKRIEDA
jgi:predicted CopG family antitoxin